MEVEGKEKKRRERREGERSGDGEGREEVRRQNDNPVPLIPCRLSKCLTAEGTVIQREESGYVLFASICIRARKSLVR